jgi:aspartate carbamoyltransferase catalytic subunit
MSPSRKGSLVKHIVAVDQFDRAWIESLFAEADRLRADRGSHDFLRGYVLATLFYEPSTRTRLSFESAMVRLGGQVISTENAREFSSAIKGETVEDTVRIVSGYADAIVIRHHEMGAAARAAAASEVPIINGGDGPGEHPTQALLDLYTIHNELGRIDDLKVALVGDLRFGRAARSLALLFRQTQNVELVFVAPDAVPMGDDVKDALDGAGVSWREEQDLTRAMGQVDVVYQTRIQRERFATPDEYSAARGVYLITPENMAGLADHAIVMHPLPRVDEIDPRVDDDPRAAYFRQAHNGVYVRMALLHQLLGSEVARR